MANGKMTKRVVINAMVAYLHEFSEDTSMGVENGVEVTIQDGIDYLTHELGLLDKKSGSKRQTKTQIENESIKETILNTLSLLDKPVTISELQAANNDLQQWSNQKISALVRQLIASGNVTKSTDGKKSLFSV